VARAGFLEERCPPRPAPFARLEDSAVGQRARAGGLLDTRVDEATGSGEELLDDPRNIFVGQVLESFGADHAVELIRRPALREVREHPDLLDLGLREMASQTSFRPCIAEADVQKTFCPAATG
jgi:hypothetical protein